jgi:hypothetical protein
VTLVLNAACALVGCAQRALSAGADETHDLLHDWMLCELSCDIVDALDQRSFICEEQAIGPAQVVDVASREAAPLQADNIEAGQTRPIANRHTVRNEVVHERRHATKERVRANTRKLNHPCPTSKNGKVADDAMASQHHVVGKDDIVADLAIVTDV